VIIAPSFADIFYNNSFKNGILLIKLDAGVVEQLFKDVTDHQGYELDVNLAAQTITKADGSVIKFEIDEFRKHRLLNGLDDIGLTLQHVDDIKAYEEKRKAEAPWLFN
jgi:3-isopropylmalate/(R)-2-methylmalate dehydratase small subunit